MDEMQNLPLRSMLGYTFNKRLGLELSGATFGYEWKYNPRYLSLDLQSYSFSKDRVRVVTSIGLALVQGQTNENKEYLAPTFNVGASLQYLRTKNSYVGLKLPKDGRSHWFQRLYDGCFLWRIFLAIVPHRLMGS